MTDLQTSTETADAVLETPVDPPAAGGGILAGLCAGELRWDVAHPFPRQDPADRALGDQAVAALRDLLRATVDPEEVEADVALPAGLTERLRSYGLLALRQPAGLGGLDLSAVNAFRVIETAMGWSVPVGWGLAIQNGLGVGAYLPLLPDGPLRRLISDKVRAGAVFADADTEPAGAANELRTTTATPSADGSTYVLDGEKICIGNGPAADFLVVSATVTDDVGPRVEYFFLDSATPGFSAGPAQEFVGLKGATIGVVRLDGVRVPAAQRLDLPADVDTELEVNRPARLYIVAAPALAIARQCAGWVRDFVRRRRIDGRPLGSYDAVQRIVAETCADLFALESVVEWCLLGEQRVASDDFRIEQSAAKNLTSTTCWRVVDRTVSLLGAEGVETARSKAARGAPPLPVERAFRDARPLRVAGGVDFLLDAYFGRTTVLERLARQDPRVEVGTPDRPPDPASLSARTAIHLEWLRAAATDLARTGGDLARADTGGDRVPTHLNRVASELFAMTVTLARAATLAAEGRTEVDDLADVYCAGARLRVADAWRRALVTDEPDHARVARRWLGPTDPETESSEEMSHE